MPRFDFHCRSCDALFEEALPFGSEKLPACPQCKSRKTEKQLTVPGIVFKGTGFYKTDSRAEPVRPSAGAGEAKSSKEPKKPTDTPKSTQPGAS